MTSTGVQLTTQGLLAKIQSKKIQPIPCASNRMLHSNDIIDHLQHTFKYKFNLLMLCKSWQGRVMHYFFLSPVFDDNISKSATQNLSILKNFDHKFKFFTHFPCNQLECHPFHLIRYVSEKEARRLLVFRKVTMHVATLGININSCHTEVFQEKIKIFFFFFNISQHIEKVVERYLAPWNTRTHLFCIVNTMAADVLATQGARTSAAMVLT